MRITFAFSKFASCIRVNSFFMEINARMARSIVIL